MPEGHVLEFTAVTKRFGPVAAVDGLTARVEPGVVTGFLGPNGAGKTTSLRILLGLVRATSGRATIGGKTYADLPHPLQTVGAALEASSFHPGRTAANHLRVYARAAGISDARVDEVLGLVGLAGVAGRKVGGFSLGMRQRLGLAYTLLGDPGVLVLDEPANGLDPEGIKWLRGFLRQLAQEGRTVLVSSHMLAEVQQTVSSLLIISNGRLVYEGDMAGLTQPDDYATIVDAPDRAALAAALDAQGIPYEQLRTGFTVREADPARLGAIAASAGIALSNLQRRGPALEEVFLDLVNGTRVHTSVAGAAPAPTDATVGGPSEVTEAAADPAGTAAAAPAPDGATPADHAPDSTAAPDGTPAAEPAPASASAPDSAPAPDPTSTREPAPTDAEEEQR
ncbi:MULTISPECIES: ATP-binding cassette domain-containing protein [unclassified Microbacterium]|uniref:ATP-binding cassette domain-containing protein n=1 Tax=unclassified Microbacterium TaxID=2609290 RepID=UPI000B0B109A|nr:MULTISPECIES: ATP-binding cassette domain-containing protein [unclassified Microbacterium]MBN9225552.1 ATP-binding cassette domain-containing protein [Microbacterium sp.]